MNYKIISLEESRPIIEDRNINGDLISIIPYNNNYTGKLVLKDENGKHFEFKLVM